jgi:ketosteroid isomerase-like protein
MSRETVEIVRRGYAAFDEGGPEAILRFLHPDIEWHTPGNRRMASPPASGCSWTATGH